MRQLSKTPSFRARKEIPLPPPFLSRVREVDDEKISGFTTSPFDSPTNEDEEKLQSPPQPIVLGQMNNISPHAIPNQVQQPTLSGQISGSSGVYGVPVIDENTKFSWKQFGGGFSFPIIVVVIFLLISGITGEFGNDGYSEHESVIGVGDGETTEFSGSIASTPNSQGCDGSISYTPVGQKDWDTPQENSWELNRWSEHSNYQLYNFSANETGEYQIRSYQNFDGYMLLYNGTFSKSDVLTNLTAANDDWGGDSSSLRSSAIDYLLLNNSNYSIVIMGLWEGESGNFELVVTPPSGAEEYFNASTDIDGVEETLVPSAIGYDWDEGNNWFWFDCWDNGDIMFETYSPGTGNLESGVIGWYDRDTGQIEIDFPSPPENNTDVEVEMYQYSENEDVICFSFSISFILVIGGIIAGFATGRKWFAIGALTSTILAPFFVFLGTIAVIIIFGF